MKPKRVTFVVDPAARACPKCGERAPASGKFRGKCGAKLAR